MKLNELSMLSESTGRGALFNKATKELELKGKLPRGLEDEIVAQTVAIINELGWDTQLTSVFNYIDQAGTAAKLQGDVFNLSYALQQIKKIGGSKVLPELVDDLYPKTVAVVAEMEKARTLLKGIHDCYITISVMYKSILMNKQYDHGTWKKSIAKAVLINIGLGKTLKLEKSDEA